MEAKPYKEQNYDKIKKDCLQNGVLFEDPIFPAETESIYRFNPIPDLTITSWKRPFELVDNPQFIVGDMDARDLFQGDVSDCWLISGIAAVADVSKDKIKYVVPEDQSFNQSEGYCGIFHFRFWQYGQWYDVVVDDRLPVNMEGCLAFCSNKKDHNEFWGPLVEKAYAKLISCYEFLHFGSSNDAIVSMTGGVSEVIDIVYSLRYKSKDVLWKQIFGAFKMGSPANIAFEGENNENPETKFDNGLVSLHAYAVRKLVEIGENHQAHSNLNNNSENKNANTIKLIKLRNPWGNECEWNGAWSDSSPEWNNLDINTKNELGLIKEFDGEFWIAFDDLLPMFPSIIFVHINPNLYIGEGESQSTPQTDLNCDCFEFHGQSIIDKSLFWNNPQYLISINSSDNAKKFLIASFICEESIREMKFQQNLTEGVTLQFHLFRVNDEENINDHKSKTLKYESNKLKPIEENQLEMSSQEHTTRFELDNGHYVIIAFAEFGNTGCKYYLRIFTENGSQSDACILNNQDDDNLIEGNNENDESN